MKLIIAPLIKETYLSIHPSLSLSLCFLGFTNELRLTHFQWSGGEGKIKVGN